MREILTERSNFSRTRLLANAVSLMFNRVLSGRVPGTEALGVARELMRILRSNTGGWHTVRERHVHERLGDRAWNGS